MRILAPTMVTDWEFSDSGFEKRISMYLPNREELSFLVVFEFPKDSMMGLVERTASSISLLAFLFEGDPTGGLTASLILRENGLLASTTWSTVAKYRI